MTMLFVLFALLGFIFMLLSTFGTPPWAVRVAWGSWLVAAVIWAVPQLGH
jgi:hypothetical protein